MMKFFDFIFYYIAKTIAVSLLRIFYHEEIVNNNVVPEKGGVLLVGNHTCWLDTIMIANAMKRKFWFVTGDFILDVPIMRNIVKHLGIIQMRKHHGKEGIAEAIDKLKNGEIVCIFPEGEITWTGEIQRFRNGVSLIQKEANVPVIPFCLEGGYETWSRGQKKLRLFTKLKITFGEPFYPTSEKEVDVANEIRNAVIGLKD